MNNTFEIINISDSNRKHFAVKCDAEIIGYTETYDDALILTETYENERFVSADYEITLGELFELWLTSKATRLSNINVQGLKSAYQHCKHLENFKYSVLKPSQMQNCIDKCPNGTYAKARIKTFWSHIDGFAYEIGITNRSNSAFVKAPTVYALKEKFIFSYIEIEYLWHNLEREFVDGVLFLLYTGFRRTEMININISDVYLKDGYIVGGIKTPSGINRKVPVHHKLEDIIKKRINRSSSGYLFENRGKQLSLSQFRILFNHATSILDIKHISSECRHTLRSRLDTAGANKVAIDKILGHKSKDIGERIYTHKSIEELKRNIELIE